jgi:hypothetical protein
MARQIPVHFFLAGRKEVVTEEDFEAGRKKNK